MPPGGGYLTSGIGIRVVMASDDYAFKVKQLEDYVKDNLHSLLLLEKARGITFGNQLHFRLVVSNCGFYSGS
jgi:hypothetical protein